MTQNPAFNEAKQVLGRLPRYARLAWELERDTRVARSQKALLALAVGYSVSPVDLIPGFLPVVGQLDDLLVLLAAIRHVLGRLPAAVREEHLRKAGVSPKDVDADYARVRAALASLARRTGRMAGRTARMAGRTGMGLLRLSARAGMGMARLLCSHGSGWAASCGRAASSRRMTASRDRR